MNSIDFNLPLVQGALANSFAGGGRGWRNRGGRGHYKGKKGHYASKKNKHTRKKNDREVIPELIDSKKIFAFNLSSHINEEHLRKFMNEYGKVEDLTIIKKDGKVKSYAFITFENEEDTMKILNLKKEEFVINGSPFGIKPGKLHFKVPGMPGFQRTQMPEREFDLEPEDPTQVSIHMLIDDVLLRIMDFLPLRDLLRIDIVCRRWQSLVHTSFRSKISTIMEDNINLWLNRNTINPTLPVVSKVLLLSGESLLSLSVSDRDMYKGRLLKVIGQLCPSLENLSIDLLCSRSIPFLRDLVMSCPYLKSFKCTQGRFLTDKELNYILVNLQNLETLHIDGSILLGDSFRNLPDTLQVLELPRCSEVMIEFLTEIYTRCPLLKVLRLDDAKCTRQFLRELGLKCQFLTDLTITCPHSSLPDFSTLKSLKKLCYKGISFSVKTLLSALPPELENLKLHGSVQETENDLVDFSIMKNLRVLSLPMQTRNSLSIQSIKTIAFCPKLVNFRYKGTNNHKPAILDIIRKCQELKELECMGITLSNEDLHPFVEANKSRVGVLKLTIGLNQSGMDVVEKLSEAKYDVNMFDVDNIFGEARYLYSDDDDDYDFYDGLSEEDYDSDHNLFDFDALDDEDFLYYDSYDDLVQPWEMIFGALDLPHGFNGYDEYDDFDFDDI